MRNGPELLQFDSLLKGLREVFSRIPDKRDPGKTDYPIKDFVTAGLAMMFWQDPCVLPFQKRIEDQTGHSNLKTMFGVAKVPSEAQFRDLLDSVDPQFILSGLRLRITLLVMAKKRLQQYLACKH